MSSPAQKVLGEEDSSGSDVGSEVAVEPETDRFGFIVTNGSTAGSVGPPPELVRQREAKWIHIISQWDRILMKKTSKVKVQCQKGIPASLRAKCWPLLCGATDRMKLSENLYQRLDSEPALQSWVDVIERDLDRQFPFHEMFVSKDGHGQRGLFRVLKAYTQHQPDEGYCQAQGPVAAVLLMNMPAEEAFWCLVQISEQYLPGYYSPLLEGVLFDAAMLTWVLKRTCPAAHKHLQHHGVEPLMFATDWLMCLFTRHLPFNTLLRVWDLFFCYGVRVLLQVAVVLVRRVLGRAEQRKQCQGQMETLERLRGVREEVQEEDDSFIAEVCSVQLSAKDLEKQTEKELQKWRKDRPSSTFDPRGRCHGYHMAWTRARHNREELDREERQRGNLSVPLTRSVSTLSLSPSLLHKRWRKGGKVVAGENEGGVKVKRHLSMGAKEDYRSWMELNLKKVQDVEEEDDVVAEEETKQTVPKETVQKELLKEQDKIEKLAIEHVEEKDTVKEHNKTETRVTEKEGSQLKETEENKMLPQQTKEPTQDQTVEVFLHPTEHVSHDKEGEEPDSDRQPLVQEQTESQDQETEAKDSSKEMEATEGEQTATVEGNQMKPDDLERKTTLESVKPGGEETIQPDVRPEECRQTENVQQTKAEIIIEEETETSPDPETDQGATAGTHTQQELITETEERSQQDSTEAKNHSPESPAKYDIKEGSHTQTETPTDKLAQTQEKVEEIVATQDDLVTEVAQTDAEEQVDPEEGTGAKTGTETLLVGSLEEDVGTVAEVEIPVVSEAFPPCSEKEIETEPTPEEENNIVTPNSQVQVDYDQTQAEEEEAQTESETNEKTEESLEVDLAKSEAVGLVAEHDGKTTTEGKSTAEEPGPEEPKTEHLEEAIAESKEEIPTAKHDGKASSEEKSTAEEPGPEEPQTESLEEPLAESKEEIPTAKHDGKASSEEKSTAEEAGPEEPKTESLEGPLAESKEDVPAAKHDGKVSTEEKSTAEEPGPEEPQTEHLKEAVAETKEESPTAKHDGKASSEEKITAEELGPQELKNESLEEALTECEEVIPVAEHDGKVSSEEKSIDKEEPNHKSLEEALAESNEGYPAAEHDGKVSSEEKAKEAAPEKPKIQLPVDAVEKEEHRENIEENIVGENNVFISEETTDSGHTEGKQHDPHQTETSVSGLKQVSVSSGDLCVRRPSSSRGSRLGRRLSEDLFIMPQQIKQSQSISNLPEDKEADSQSNPGAVKTPQTSEVTADPPKRFGLFRRLRGEQPKKTKMQVPKILIQDFSDGTGKEKTIKEDGEEKLSSKERRRRRRERERREKEEERVRKKKEKELEKERERERRKPQTRGKSFQGQKEKGNSEASPAAKTGQPVQRTSVSYAESYF